MAQDKEVTAEVKKATAKKAAIPKAAAKGSTTKKVTPAKKTTPAKKAPAKKTVAAKKAAAPKVAPEAAPHTAFTHKEEKLGDTENLKKETSTVEEIKEVFEETVQVLEETFSGFVERSTVNLKEWNKLMMATNDVVLEKVSEKSKEFYEYASKKPLSTLLVSVGVGAALYKAFKRR